MLLMAVLCYCTYMYVCTYFIIKENIKKVHALFVSQATYLWLQQQVSKKMATHPSGLLDL